MERKQSPSNDEPSPSQLKGKHPHLAIGERGLLLSLSRPAVQTISYACDQPLPTSLPDVPLPAKSRLTGWELLLNMATTPSSCPAWALPWVTGVGRPELLVDKGGGRAGAAVALGLPMLPEGKGESVSSASMVDDSKGWLCDMASEVEERVGRSGGNVVGGGMRFSPHSHTFCCSSQTTSSSASQLAPLVYSGRSSLLTVSTCHACRSLSSRSGRPRRPTWPRPSPLLARLPASCTSQTTASHSRTSIRRSISRERSSKMSRRRRRERWQLRASISGSVRLICVGERMTWLTLPVCCSSRQWTVLRQETLDPSKGQKGDLHESFYLAKFGEDGRPQQPLPPTLAQKQDALNAFFQVRSSTMTIRRTCTDTLSLTFTAMPPAQSAPARVLCPVALASSRSLHPSPPSHPRPTPLPPLPTLHARPV